MSAIQVAVDINKWLKFVKALPQIANSQVNDAYVEVAKEFAKDFSKKRLIKGVYNVKPRRGKKDYSRIGKGRIEILKRARNAGITARLGGAGSLKNKNVRIYTKNPLLVMREYGEVVRATKTKGKDRVPYLYIHADLQSTLGTNILRQKFGRGNKVKTLRQQYKISRVKSGKSYYGRPIVAKVRRVGPFPLLKFKATWNTFIRTRFSQISRKYENKIAQKTNDKLKRLAA